MTNAQKLALRLSEVRQRLNEIAALEGDDFTDEVRAEADRLTAEYRDKETQHRAAIVAEADEAQAAADGFDTGDGEPGKPMKKGPSDSINGYNSVAWTGSNQEPDGDTM